MEVRSLLGRNHPMNHPMNHPVGDGSWVGWTVAGITVASRG
jgi:hypothetical protein